MGSNDQISNHGKLKNMLCAWHFLWTFLLIISILCYTPWLFRSPSLPLFNTCTHTTTATADRSRDRIPWSGDLRDLETSWNDLSFGSNPSRKPLKIALFVKKWPAKDMAGGLERHARTLHRSLANRGHTVHVFTTRLPGRNPSETPQDDAALHFHYSDPTPAGNLNHAQAWPQFLAANRSLNGFHILHTESVALPHGRARNLSNVVVSWHGIAYETIHSDIVQDLTRNPAQIRPLDLHKAITERVQRVIEEIKFFPGYAHHVATSDYVGDVLRTVYMLPLENVHIIVNGVDEAMFRPDKHRGNEFRLKYGIPLNARLVMGMAGRLVKDKGHPIVFEVLQRVLQNKSNENLFVLIAGDGPWASRYKELAPNVKVLGPLGSSQIGAFYNALDIFVNPTLRAQGLDHTLIEAMLCGKPLLATHFSSITRSVIVNGDYGYTFSPRFESLRMGLLRVIEDGKEVLEKKGLACWQRASVLFTANKMASAYERLFYCVSQGMHGDSGLCQYPLPSD
eukprot:Gb_14433 [translate_table: standard]